MSSRLIRSIAAAIFVVVSVVSFVRGNTVLGIIFLVAAVLFVLALVKSRNSNDGSR